MSLVVWCWQFSAFIGFVKASIKLLIYSSSPSGQLFHNDFSLKYISVMITQRTFLISFAFLTCLLWPNGWCNEISLINHSLSIVLFFDQISLGDRIVVNSETKVLLQYVCVSGETVLGPCFRILLFLKDIQCTVYFLCCLFYSYVGLFPLSLTVSAPIAMILEHPTNIIFCLQCHFWMWFRKHKCWNSCKLKWFVENGWYPVGIEWSINTMPNFDCTDSFNYIRHTHLTIPKNKYEDAALSVT